MTFEIHFLTGPREGQTQALEHLPVRLTRERNEGVLCAPSRDGATAGHAEIVRVGPRMVVRQCGDLPLYVNGNQVRESLLTDRDLLQIGPRGPRITFRGTSGRRATKTMGIMLHDSVATARATGHTTRLSMALGVGKELVREAMFHGTRSLRLALIALTTVVLVGGGFFAYHLVTRAREQEQTNATLTSSIASLQEQVGQRVEELNRTLSGIKLGSRELGGDSTPLAERLEEAELLLTKANERLGALEDRDEAHARQVRQGQRAVGFVFGTMSWQDPKSRLPVRMRVHFPGGPPVQSPDGSVIMTVDGEGPEVIQSYFGTAFLVSPEGLMITNRHVADPWIGNATADKLMGRGFAPIIRSFTVYFPGIARGLPARRLRASDEVDLALLRVDLGEHRIPPLALAPRSVRTESGGQVVLLGYPGGIAGLVVKLENERREQLLEGKPEPDYIDILNRLAAWDAVHPTVTSGLLGNVLPKKLVYEAATTSGGSGGPICDERGRVIGVNYAIFEGFSGSNFGVPVAFIHRLLAEQRQAMAAR